MHTEHPLLPLLQPKTLLATAGGLALIVILTVWILLSLRESYCLSDACLKARVDLEAQETLRERIEACRLERGQLRQDYVNQAFQAANTDVQAALLARLEALLDRPCKLPGE